jgi:hypothetical protein
MLPYILAAVGGYLIGDSLKGKQFADGGYIDKSNLTFLKNLRSEKPIKAVAWIVTEVNGEPKVMQFSSLQKAKEAKYNLQSTSGKLRIITSVDELKKELLPYDIDDIAHYVYYFPAKQPAMGAPKGWLADGGMMADGGEIFVGRFDENQFLSALFDSSAIEKAQKESGYKYIKSKMVKKGGKPFMEVYLVKDPNQATFADGGMMADGTEPELPQPQEIQKSKLKSFTILWSEATRDFDNKTCTTWKAANEMLMNLGRKAERRAGHGYDKTKIQIVWENGHTIIDRLDFSGNDGHFNPFKTSVQDYLKQKKSVWYGSTLNLGDRDTLSWEDEETTPESNPIGFMAGGGTMAKGGNIKSLFNQFHEEKPSILLIMIADEVSQDFMRKKFDSTIVWDKLSNEEKEKYNSDYTKNKKEFEKYLMYEFVRLYYSDKKVKEKCKGSSKSTISAIKSVMTDLAKKYPENKYADGGES